MLATVFWPIVGGLAIGAASVILLLMTGRLAGISGILWGAVSQGFGGGRWQILFVIGLLVGTWIFHAVSGEPFPPVRDNYLMAVLSGLLVGLGVKIGNGCTSGHGVCGIGNLSPRSIVATLTFMFAGIVTVLIFNNLFPYPRLL